MINFDTYLSNILYESPEKRIEYLKKKYFNYLSSSLNNVINGELYRRGYLGYLLSAQEEIEYKRVKDEVTNEEVNKLLLLFSETDPTPNKEYMEWIVKQYIDNNGIYHEDYPKYTEVLDLFNQLKKKKSLNFEKDINKYRNLTDLYNTIVQFKEPDDVILKQLISKLEVEARDGEWVAYKFPNEESLVKIANYTNWCVKSRSVCDRYWRDGWFLLIANLSIKPFKLFLVHYDMNNDEGIQEHGYSDAHQIKDISDKPIDYLDAMSIYPLLNKIPEFHNIFNNMKKMRGVNVSIDAEDHVLLFKQWLLPAFKTEISNLQSGYGITPSLVRSAAKLVRDKDNVELYKPILNILEYLVCREANRRIWVPDLYVFQFIANNTKYTPNVGGREPFIIAKQLIMQDIRADKHDIKKDIYLHCVRLVEIMNDEYKDSGSEMEQ